MIGPDMVLRRVHLDRPRPHHLLWLAVAAAVLCFVFYQRTAGGTGLTGSDGTDGSALNIPSPGTLGLMAVGFLALIPWGRRRRHHRG